MRPNEHARIEEALRIIDNEEERTLRLFAAGRVTEEIWNHLWSEWQDRRQQLIGRRESLGRQQAYHIGNLDAALHIISKIGVLYGGLDEPQKRQLLREIIERVVVNADGEILRMELLAPFTYLTKLSQKLQVIEVGKNSKEAESETASLFAGCSTCTTLGVPDGIQSEHVSPQTTAQFLQQLTFPQSAVLQRLTNKLQI
jgi:hypothetical protein